MEKEKIWKGMIEKDPDSAAEKFTSSILTDKKLYVQDITGTAAYALGLKSIGIITSDELGTILNGLKTVKSIIEKGGIDFTAYELSLIHISEPTRQAEISYAVFCLK